MALKGPKNLPAVISLTGLAGTLHLTFRTFHSTHSICRPRRQQQRDPAVHRNRAIPVGRIIYWLCICIDRKDEHKGEQYLFHVYFFDWLFNSSAEKGDKEDRRGSLHNSFSLFSALGFLPHSTTILRVSLGCLSASINLMIYCPGDNRLPFSTRYSPFIV